MGEQKLEEKIIQVVCNFANQKDLAYSIQGSSCIGNKKIVRIQIGKYDPEKIIRLSESFRHEIIINDPKNLVVHERTYYVASSILDRQFYIDFIKHLDGEGIKLTNSFEKLWKENPRKYPI